MMAILRMFLFMGTVADGRWKKSPNVRVRFALGKKEARNASPVLPLPVARSGRIA
jgi:hypothetical protein